MKVARFSRVRPALSVADLFGTLSPGPSGQVPVSTGSNSPSVAWGSNISDIFINGTEHVLGPHVNFANGSNVTVTVDKVGSVPSNTIRWHATGGAASFGSNATHVAEISAAGASSDSARMDHYHAGIGTITASSSNTMQRGTWNLRPGAGIALNLTDTDGDGEFDTTTIVNTGQGGGGGESSSATFPSVVAYRMEPFSSTNSKSVTITAAASGHRFLLAISSYSRDVNTPTCTNVTFTEVLAVNHSTSTFLSVYLGVVSGGSSGTTITITAGSSDNIFATVVEIEDALTTTPVDTGSSSGADASTNRGVNIGPLDVSPGDIFVIAYSTNNATSQVEFFVSAPMWFPPRDSLDGLRMGIGVALSAKLSGYYIGGTSGQPYAVGIVALTT